jgi:hypothetical protein
VRFTSRDECETFARRLGRSSDLLDRKKLTTMKKRFDFLYESRLENADEVAGAIASCCEPFSDILLWSHGLVWGDKTRQPDASPDWSHYGAWRREHGATGGLYDLPGQLFESGEQRELVEGVKWTLLTGSDAILIPRPTRVLIHFSHDDLISVHCRSTPTALRDLERLKLKRIVLP